MLTSASISCCTPPSRSQFKGVKPSGDRVLVKVDKEEGKTQGGVLLPTVAQNKPTAGAVVALGEVELVKVRPARCPGALDGTVADAALFVGRGGSPIGAERPQMLRRGARAHVRASSLEARPARAIAAPPCGAPHAQPHP